MVQFIVGLLVILVGFLLPILPAVGASIVFPSPIAGVPHTVSQPIWVTHTGDDGMGSLRWAIAQANQTPIDDVIDLSRISGQITLRSSLPPITHNLSIIGDGNDRISGDLTHRVLWIKQGHVSLQNLTIQDGLAQGATGQPGAGGAAGMGGGLFIDRGSVILSQVQFVNNRAIGGNGTPSTIEDDAPDLANPLQPQIDSSHHHFEVNRGAILGINGISSPEIRSPEIQSPKQKSSSSRDNDSRGSDSRGSDSRNNGPTIASSDNRLQANRGAIAGVNGIGIDGIGTIAFGGGGGFGGFGNAGNGGNGGNGGGEGGNGGNGGNGGDGGVGIFGSFGRWEGEGSIGAIAFGGGGGFGGFGNAGNGGNGGNAVSPIANGGNGGDGGNGGFGGGGGAGGKGGNGGQGGIPGKAGNPGASQFGGGQGGRDLGGGGAGFGGAIFVRSGRLILSHTRFERNTAIGGRGANPGQGKGGAIFIMPEDSAEQPSQASTKQADIPPPPSVVSLKQLPAFMENVASDAGTLPTDNSDVYGLITVRLPVDQTTRDR